MNTFVDLFEGAANLRSMVVLSFPSNILLPYWHLTHLYIVYLSVDAAFTILDLCKAIVHCSLSHCRKDSHLRLITSNLRSLCIEADEAVDLAQMFQALTLPSLTSIKLDASWLTNRVWCQDDFLTMLDRSACSLQTLIFNQVAITEFDVIQCLRRIPSLTHLDITEARSESLQKRIITNNLLCLLTTNHPGPLGPSLTHIALGGTLSIHDSFLARMAESRWEPSPVERLQFLEISLIGRTMDRQAARFLRKLGGRGFTFVLREDGAKRDDFDDVDDAVYWDPYEASRSDLEADECDAFIRDQELSECDLVIRGLKARIELLNSQLASAEEHRRELLSEVN